MNLPFPTLTPRIVDPRWFTADTPCDEEIEVAMIEQKFQIWVKLTSVGQRYLNMNPLGKIAPEPMEEEAETDEEEGNDDSDDTEDTHDDEDEEEIVYTRGPEGGLRVGSPPLDIPIAPQPTVGPHASHGSHAHTPHGPHTPHTPHGGNNNNDVVMNDSNVNSERPSL